MKMIDDYFYTEKEIPSVKFVFNGEMGEVFMVNNQRVVRYADCFFLMDDAYPLLHNEINEALKFLA